MYLKYDNLKKKIQKYFVDIFWHQYFYFIFGKIVCLVNNGIIILYIIVTDRLFNIKL